MKTSPSFCCPEKRNAGSLVSPPGFASPCGFSGFRCCGLLGGGWSLGGCVGEDASGGGGSEGFAASGNGWPPPSGSSSGGWVAWFGSGHMAAVLLNFFIALISFSGSAQPMIVSFCWGKSMQISYIPVGYESSLTARLQELALVKLVESLELVWYFTVYSIECLLDLLNTSIAVNPDLYLSDSRLLHQTNMRSDNQRDAITIDFRCIKCSNGSLLKDLPPPLELEPLARWRAAKSEMQAESEKRVWRVTMKEQYMRILWWLWKGIIWRAEVWDKKGISLEILVSSSLSLLHGSFFFFFMFPFLDRCLGHGDGSISGGPCGNLLGHRESKIWPDCGNEIKRIHHQRASPKCCCLRDKKADGSQCRRLSLACFICQSCK